MRPSHWLNLLLVLAAVPVLQGAGCRAHYGARLYGAVAPDRSIREEHAGKPVHVIYRRRTELTKPCTVDWTPCMLETTWMALTPCDALEGDEGKTPTVTLGIGQEQVRFDACTHLIGLEYEADLAAFIDVDGDGLLGAGEPYGVWDHNPLNRDREELALPLKIRIDRTLRRK
jgi:hypothetical protein